MRWTLRNKNTEKLPALRAKLRALRKQLPAKLRVLRKQLPARSKKLLAHCFTLRVQRLPLREKQRVQLLAYGYTLRQKILLLREKLRKKQREKLPALCEPQLRPKLRPRIVWRHRVVPVRPKRRMDCELEKMRQPWQTQTSRRVHRSTTLFCGTKKPLHKYPPKGIYLFCASSARAAEAACAARSWNGESRVFLVYNRNTCGGKIRTGELEERVAPVAGPVLI
jgi:hypothetical protein